MQQFKCYYQHIITVKEIIIMENKDNKELTNYDTLSKEELQEKINAMPENEREAFVVKMEQKEKNMRVPEAMSERVRNNLTLSK